jgi:hypothetical protein
MIAGELAEVLVTRTLRDMGAGPGPVGGVSHSGIFPWRLVGHA